MTDLNIAEIPFENGQVRFRYARYLDESGERWIRHGLFRAYYSDGSLASEGTYEHGREHGLWRDFHPNGQLAAEGHYDVGVETGPWKFWTEDGQPQATR